MSDPIIERRCSRLPLLFNCPSSHEEVQYKRDVDSAPAALGTLVHDALAMWFVEKPQPVLSDEAERLVEYGIQAWDDLGKQVDMDRCIVEGFVDFARSDLNWSLTGHPDIHIPGEVVVDYKSGWADSNYVAQMIGYGLCTQSLNAVVVDLRRRVFDVIPLPTETEAIRLITEKVDQIGEVKNPGSWCSWCGHHATCKEFLAWTQGSVQALVVSDSVCAMDRPQIIEISKRLPALEAAIRAFKAVRAVAVDAHGPLDLGDGTEMRFVESTKTDFDVQAAWPVMDAELSDDELAGSVTIVRKNLEGYVRSHAAHMEKTKRWNTFFGKLGNAGAVSMSKRRALKRVKTG